jgi:phospholipase/carboxylesterase
MKNKLDSIEINPTTGKEIGTVIWLHGLGADGNDFVPLLPELNLPDELPLRFVFPHAPQRPVTINNGFVMRAWYDIYSITSNQRVDQEGISDSVQLLERLIEHELQRGMPAEKILLAGFSQGAVIA